MNEIFFSDVHRKKKNIKYQISTNRSKTLKESYYIEL